MRNSQVRTTKDDLAAAWQELVAQVKNKPWLLRLLAERGSALAARYALWKERFRRLRQGERRRLQRRLGVGLAGAALLLALNGGPTAHAGAPIVADGATCTLADAINSANTNSAVGGCTTGYAGADTIDLQVDVTLTASNNATYGPTGLPVVTSEITIEGNGHTISRDGSATTETFRILAVGSGGNLTLNSATISGGNARGSQAIGGGIHAQNAAVTVMNSTLSGNVAGIGGGIFASYTTVLVANSTVSHNWASAGGGLNVQHGSLSIIDSTLNENRVDNEGGGIRANATTVTLTNSTLSGNAAVRPLSSGDGGGISVEDSLLMVSNCTLIDNGAGWQGGGIDAAGATVEISHSTLNHNGTLTPLGGGSGGGINVENSVLTVSNSVLSGNWSDQGGGIRAFGSDVTILASLLHGNFAGYEGGGIAVGGSSLTVLNTTLSGNLGWYFGGGIFGGSSSLIVANSTLSGNSARWYSGGGIFGSSSSLAVANSTLSGNSALNSGGGIYARYAITTTLQRSLISGNSAGLYGREVFNRGRATIGAGRHNIFGHNGETNSEAFTAFTPSGSDIIATSDGTEPVALASILSGALADNDSDILAGAPSGSIVQTLALPTGSPAIDAAPSVACAAPIFDLDQRAKVRNFDGNGVASSNECDIGAFETQAPTALASILVHKQTLPDGDPTPFLFKLRGPVGRDFALTDDQPHSTGVIPAGVYTLEEILPPGWDPALPFAQMTCDDGSPLSAIDLAADEVLVCRFLNYKRGNIIVKKVTIPPVAAPSFAMRLIDNSTQKKTLFSLANTQQFDTGAISSVPTYKLLETVPGGWKKKSIVCNNGSPSAAIVVPPGGTVTCTVTNENSAPGGIQLSSNSLKENQPVGTVIGTLSAGDSVAGDTHTFTFVDDGSAGASGNSKFQIAGKQLKSAAVFDYETKTSYNIKLKVTDSAGQTKVKNFVISIIDGPN